MNYAATNNPDMPLNLRLPGTAISPAARLPRCGGEGSGLYGGAAGGGGVGTCALWNSGVTVAFTMEW